MIDRLLHQEILEDLTYFPIIGILGARQVGKTTLVKLLMESVDSVYLDLELDSDIRKLDDAETFLRSKMHKCIILDEIQQMPTLFPLLRALVDEDRRPARFVILGSSSPALIKGSSESLAGRIVYKELSVLSLTELSSKYELRHHWLQGGYPAALLATNARMSNRWLSSYLRTITERDLVGLGISLPPIQIRRFLSMLAHLHGSLVNYNMLSASMGISHPTVKKYIDILEGSFLIRQLPPYHINTGKRLVKSHKIYFRDSGLLHNLLNINKLDMLYGHPIIGASWEGYVISQIYRVVPDTWEMYFYRTHGGAECDLILVDDAGDLRCIEIKYNNAPRLSRGFHQCIVDLKPIMSYVIVPDIDPYDKEKNIVVTNLMDFLRRIRE